MSSSLRGALLALQLLAGFAPAAVLLMAMAFDGESHRGHGSDFHPTYLRLAWAVVLAAPLVWAWIAWTNLRSPLPLAGWRFWLPGITAVVAVPAVFGALALGEWAQARASWNEQRARMATIQEEVESGDPTRSCELVPLYTRDNLRGAVGRLAREADITTCLAHAASLSSAEARIKVLEDGFLHVRKFLELDPEAAALPIDRSSSPPPPFPAATQVAITRAYWSTFLALPESPTTEDAGDLMTKVFQLQNWDDAAREVFKREYAPELVRRLDAAIARNDGSEYDRANQTRARKLLLAFPRNID